MPEETYRKSLVLKLKLAIDECRRLKSTRKLVGKEYDEKTSKFYRDLEDSADVVESRLEHATVKELEMFDRVLLLERSAVAQKYVKLAHELLSGEYRLNDHMAKVKKATKGMTYAEAAVWEMEDAVEEIKKQVAEGLLDLVDIRSELDSAMAQTEKLKLAIESSDEKAIEVEHNILLNESYHLTNALMNAYAKNAAKPREKKVLH